MITISAVEQNVSLRTKNGGNIFFYHSLGVVAAEKLSCAGFVSDNFSFSRDGVEITISLG